MMTSYDIVVPLVRKNTEFFLHIALPVIRKNLSPRKIFVVGSKMLAEAFQDADCEFIDEDTIVPGCTLEKVRELITQRGGQASRAGWYFQQFLKMGWARFTDQPCYLVWDADTIPVHKITFFDEEGHIFFNQKKEFHQPYFSTLDTLFWGSVKKEIEGSFIAEHMMIAQDPMKKMLDEIERNFGSGTVPFYEAIIKVIPDDALSHSGFSEFETFGNWVFSRMPGLYRSRMLRSMRQGGVFLGRKPSRFQLSIVEKYYDVVSFEVLEKRRINASFFMPVITMVFVIFGGSLPRIISCYNSLRRFYFRKIRHEDIYIVE